ncbi:MAG: ATP-binding cassette domain-containing protein [Clostridiales bacterium]|jgi:ATPase subunit of ABC transporter with duplicated ATPase domains|nr:ATP-binding cassette domain-containing protein [Clostridiales bacterium]
MAVLEVTNLTHCFGEKILYKKANFEIFKGEKVGIVGQNGTGKTTLLKSLIGKVIPDSGNIQWQKNLKISYLDQYSEINQNLTIFEYLKTAFKDLFEIENKLNKIYENLTDTNTVKISNYQNLLLNNGFYELENIILKVANGLGITAIGIENSLKNLSGGQRTKVILAKFLLEKPNVLLLDEPTNFLDIKHIDWLTKYLKNFKNNIFLISHDFDFLDKATNCTLNIEFQKITKYTGSFTKFLKTKNLYLESYINEYKLQQKEIKKHENYIVRNKARASTAQQAQSRIKTLEKIERLTAPKITQKPQFKLISLFSKINSQKALEIHDLEIGYEKPLLPKINLNIKSCEKIAIIGFNGIGKSTLIKTLIKEKPAISGWFQFSDHVKINYFEQSLNWPQSNLTPLEIISEKFPKLSQQQIRKTLAQCGISAKNAMQSVITLSGGEQSKVKLCILVNTKSNFLILDEPTNHLDADAKTILKEQLKNWQGNLILISHEKKFYEDLIDDIIKLK